MESKKRNGLIVLVVILIILVLCLGGYIVYDKVLNKNNSEQTTENTNNNVPVNEITTEKNNTISEKDIHEFSSFVPYIAYSQKNINVNNIEQKVLITSILSIFDDCLDTTNCPISMDYDKKEIEIKNAEEFTHGYNTTDKYVPLNYFNSLASKMYGKNFSNIEETKTLSSAYQTGMTWIYQDGNFIRLSGGDNSNNFFNYIDGYEFANDDLIIYEYAAGDDYFLSAGIKLCDIYTRYCAEFSKKEAGINDDNDMSYYYSYLSNYLKEHKSNYTRYKHTFKHNSQGYYWYSTEVVS